MSDQRQFKLSFNGIIGLITIIGVFVLLFFIARGIFSLLSLVAPFLLIGALIINYKTVIGYGRFIINLFRRNILGALAMIVLTIVGFPIVCGFLFGKALVDRKILKLYAAQRQSEAFTEYEDVTEQDSFLDLKELPGQQPEKTDYDDFFDERNT